MNRITTWLFAILIAVPCVAQGQAIRVTAGEHADFTRVVLRIPAGMAWTVTDTDEGHAFVPSTRVDFDLSRLFDRIPRRRLASARLDAGGLVLALACDCPIRAWEERAGFVVIDILDAPVGSLRIGPSEIAISRPLLSPSPVPDYNAMARQVGEAIARARRETATTPTESRQQPMDENALDSLAVDLGRRFANALGQGLLHAQSSGAAQSVVLRSTEIPIGLPENMRIVDATRSPASTMSPTSPIDASCHDSGALDFLLDRPDPGFLQGLSALGHDLYGEFDQSSHDGILRLVQHYLAASLGAEARILINNLRDPLPGRDLLLGLSDVLEGRMSNSRLRLAEATECTGAVALAAALAHPDNRIAAIHAPPIALTFGRLPPPLQAAVAADLVNSLLEAGAIDSARVIADGLRHSNWVTPEAIALIDAMLEGRRGEAERAASHLDTIVLQQAAGTLAWLEVALRAQTPVSDETLADAEALASQHRGSVEGNHIMAAIIRLRTMTRRPESALITLDRLESWGTSQSQSRETIATLRDETWRSLARLADDRSFVSLSLVRTDWLDPGLTLATRQALAMRFIDLGFANAATRLIESEHDPQSLRLSAQAALLRNEPEAVSGLLEGDYSSVATLIRATAASRLGAYDEATALLDSSGDLDATARSAILQGEWRMIEDLQERGVSLPGLDVEAGQFLGRAPGVAEVLHIEPSFSTGRRPADQPASSPAPIERQSVPDADLRDDATEISSIPVEQYPAPGAEDFLDNLGIVSHAGLLLAESERLRAAIGAALQSNDVP